MIFAVHVWKTADGLLYVKARDEGQVWDYIDNNDINMEDVVWGEDYMGDYECEDADDVMDAMIEDNYVTIKVRIEEAEHCVYLHVSDDE